jgi:glycosyltransferase involved in cell wall biosynthesis
MPELSIITVNYNNLEGLKKTMSSVFEQTFKAYEYIIIDGGSEDGSKACIEQYSDRLSYQVSEQDTGIFNAMNKAVARAKGEYLLFLNSGDLLNDNSVLEDIMSLTGKYDIIYGNLLICESSGQWVKKYDEELSFEYFIYDTLPHQGSFIRKELFSKVGNYDESLKISSDWKFFLLAVHRHKVDVKYVDRIIAQYDYNGISSDPANNALKQQERVKTMEDEFGDYYKLFKEMREYRQKYNLLNSSRVVKGYQAIRKMLGLSKT